MVDTTQLSITWSNRLFRRRPAIGGKPRRATARTSATLSRALRLTSFDLSIESEGAPISATGTVEGDTALVLDDHRRRGKAGSPARSAQRCDAPPHDRPDGRGARRPTKGREAIRVAGLRSGIDGTEMWRSTSERSRCSFSPTAPSSIQSTKRWYGVRPDTIRGWHVVAEANGGFSGLGGRSRAGSCDDTARLRLERSPSGRVQNWRTIHALPSPRPRTFLETTASDNKPHLRTPCVDAFRRPPPSDLAPFDLEGQRQHLAGDTLYVRPWKRRGAGGRLFGLCPAAGSEIRRTPGRSADRQPNPNHAACPGGSPVPTLGGDVIPARAIRGSSPSESTPGFTTRSGIG